MTVIVFPPRREAGGWQERELQLLMQVFAAHAAGGEASAWKIGATDLADPQFYILGPAPDSDCILSLSRVGRDYVLEDGGGNVLGEGRSLRAIAEKAAKVTFEAKKASLAARAILVWCMLRHSFEEKVEPLMAEPMELMTHLVPPLAAIA
jgi:hypothetical protein